MKRRKNMLQYFAKNITVVVALVLIWRGIWYVIDELDIILFGGSHIESAILGIILGLVMLYLPDGDLKEIEKL
jgi:presenilin-like A22 family membrane protease